MALKFLNKKGWHTGSLRNIENVWKAEQKHEAEQKKLEELKKQIREERERAGFRQLQEEAGLISKQERLEFLYDSGLAVGKSSGFKALENLPKTEQEGAPSSSASAKDSAAPGALFEDKPQSSNDAWRKLHSDPLLLIRQREQEALARIKNNPVKMAMIRKSVESEKGKDKEEKKKRKKGDRKSSKRHRHSSPDNDSDSDSRDARRPEKRRDGHHEKSSYRPSRTSDDESTKKYREKEHRTGRHEGYTKDDDRQKSKPNNDRDSHYGASDKPPRYESRNTRRKPTQLSEEERAAKLREMQMDAELHEQHRWKLLKKAEDKDKQEATRDEVTRGRNFLDSVEKSVYGTDKGGSLTIEESVRRRTHYSQGRSATETNAFRRS